MREHSLQVTVTNRQILQIALPISAALLIPNINFITNNIFLGGLGETELGNAGTVGVYYLIMMVSGSGLSNAIQALISRKAGEESIGGIHRIFTQGVRISLFFSLVWMLITWFLAPLCLRPFIQEDNFRQEMSFLNIRICGLPFLYLFQCGNAFLIGTLNSRYMMIGTIGQALVNIFFDYVLIYGRLGFPNMGFNGAAYSSIIAELTGVLVVYAVIWRKGLKKKFYLFSDLAYDKTNTKAILKISAPLVIQFSISLITWLLFFILLEQYGSTAKAISNTMRNVFGIVGVFIWAFASTSNTMVSNLIGQKKESKVLHVINKITMLSFGLTLGMVVILNLFPQGFFSIYSQGKEFTEEGISVLRVVSIGMMGMSVAAIWLNAVTGTGRTKINLLIELIAVTVYIIYIYFIMIKWKLSLTIAWTNELLYWLVIFAMAFAYIRSGRWKSKSIGH